MYILARLSLCALAASTLLPLVVDAVSDVLELGADSTKPTPEMNASVDAGFIMGIGCAKSGDLERIPLLSDVEALMNSAEMGLIDTALQRSSSRNASARQMPDLAVAAP